MRKRRILALLLALAMVLSGCQGAQNETPPENPEVGDTPAPPVFTQEDLAEAEEIVADALKRGEAANLLHTGELSAVSGRGDLFYPVDCARSSPPFETQVDLPALLASLHTEADIEAVYRRAFVPELAEQYIGALFSGSEAAYRFGEAGELLRNQLPAIPLSLVVWDRSVREILEWTEEKLVVELEGRYMLTGAAPDPLADGWGVAAGRELQPPGIRPGGGVLHPGGSAGYPEGRPGPGTPGGHKDRHRQLPHHCPSPDRLQHGPL